MPTPTFMSLSKLSVCYEKANSIYGELQEGSSESAGKQFSAALQEAQKAANGHHISHFGGNKLPNSSLQLITLGPQVDIIMPEGHPPDDQSLLAFAHSQGVDGYLIQQILENVVAQDGSDAELDIQPGELCSDVPLVCESLAVLFQPLDVVMPMAVAPQRSSPLVTANYIAASTMDSAAMAAGTAGLRLDMVVKPQSGIHDALAVASTAFKAEVQSSPAAANVAGGGCTATPSEWLSPTSSTIPGAIAPQRPSPVATANYIAASTMDFAAMAAGTAALSVAPISSPASLASANINLAGGDQMALHQYRYARFTPAQPGADELRNDGATLQASIEEPSILAQVAGEVSVGATEARAVAILADRSAGVAKLGLPNLLEFGVKPLSDPGISAVAINVQTESSSPRWDPGARLLIDLGGTAPDNQESMSDANFRRSEQYQLLSDRLSAALGQRAAAEFGRGNWQLTLQLNPAYLGRIDVRLGRRASGHIDAEFSATQRDTQDLLQNGMGRLREVVAASGLDIRLLDVRQGGSTSGGHPQPSRQGSAVPFTAALRIDGLSSTVARTHIDYIGSDGLDVMA